MFNINNIKIGDYIETKNGRIGYIYNIGKCYDIYVEAITIKYNDATDIVMYLAKDFPSDIFKQIGNYIFDKEKIELLKYDDFTETTIYDTPNLCRYIANSEILSQEIRGGKDICKTIKHKDKLAINKINEIIKWINERG